MSMKRVVLVAAAVVILVAVVALAPVLGKLDYTRFPTRARPSVPICPRLTKS
ncbi:MAG: hypothetical protein BMS9Abin37_0229 [Acidobacteriota bacterium]|nr:MAG: hypothetical protein BMS9Abin37_0229 [Acidobacteriota bacterium]